jgi:OmpA-OmpF porin, OOP family
MRIGSGKMMVWMLWALSGLFPFMLSAQPQLSTKSKKAIELYIEADNYRVRQQYDKAVTALNQAIEKDENFEEAYFRLALTWRSQENMPKAIDNFEKGLRVAKDTRKQNMYRFELGESNLRIGNYSRALEYLNQFLTSDKSINIKTDQAKVWRSQADYGLAHQDEALSYSPKPLSDTVNTFPLQFAPVLSADNRQLIFTKRFGHEWDDNEDIYISTKNTAGQWTTPVSISDNINTPKQEGACTISADGHYLIYTGCGGKTYGSCDLFESKKTGEQWSVAENLGPLVNSSAWDVQPSLSADGQELYFVSSRKGGMGGHDIWYTRKDSTGRWMKARNVGEPINTRYDEISPFIHVNNRTLYFSSNGFPGFGGLDIFVSEKVNKAWGPAKNMGAPLNNFEDQFSFFVTTDGKTAYYSKDLVGQKNHTKLYSTPLPKEVQVQYYGNVVTGKVTDKESGKPIQTKVELYDIQKNERVSVVTSDSVTGDYTIVLTQGTEYALYSTSPGYLFNSLSFNYTAGGNRKPVVVNIDLEKAKINAKTVLNNIFFETDKYDLREKSVTELQEVIRFLKNNSAIRVEIGGHTDNVGAAAYNLQLSEKRAQSVADYFVQHGIELNRITQKGYGASQPVLPNDSEINRQANRRIEFKIIN